MITENSISRQKTAIRRSEISRPVRLALEHGLVTTQDTFFDYGCGLGDDIEYLGQRGIEATGWDPVYRPNEDRVQSDVVNIGYVVNVIEDPIERENALREASSLSKKLLIVSARLSIEIRNCLSQSQFADGYITRWRTFQKFYEQHELRDWINQTLNVQGVAVAPGIFYVFRDADLLHSFAASRYRRTSAPPRQKNKHLIFDENRELFDPLFVFLTSRGRLPDESEIDAAGVRERIGNLRRAFAILRDVIGLEQWAQIREERSQDLLIYLALTRFGGRPRFSQLPFDLRLDVRAFFSTYRRACKLADDLLFSAGKPDTVNEACIKSSVGKLTPEALYVHTSALSLLPPVLRIYEGCARAYIGAVEGANVVKMSRRKAQISYLYYPNFERDPHPALIGSLVVPLTSFSVRYQDYADSQNPFILHRKEAFISADHPLRAKFARLTDKEERAGLYEEPQSIGTRSGWQRVLDDKGFRLAGHRLLRNDQRKGAIASS